MPPVPLLCVSLSGYGGMIDIIGVLIVSEETVDL